ncbi:uncharacterized protein COLE_01241 [Cutaneotrichosporon oleaginosum]|uniref:uncharacterized protein n=1 Tax=Cutaneotrichosporon oleaginosum TaxID=879819 RepID=UPI00132A9D8A|nr:hypothetical protein COLE_01241 [Cutaneotrichosporon oleaginosum]
MDSSSTSSPFSTRSTIPSSPENISGDNAPTGPNGLLTFPHTSGQLMQGMQAILSNLTGATSYGSFGNFGIRQADAQPDGKQAAPASSTGQAGGSASARPSTSTAQSMTGTATGSGHGGSRTEPPKRIYTVDGLQVSTPALDDIAAGYSTRRNKILLQGDPQVIHKQRVETAIRVIIDMLRQIPPSPSAPNPHTTLATLIPRDPSGNSLYTFERLANFRGLRLQAGTTTKTSSKKQLAQGAIPLQHLAFVETAVYMSGENGKRVYACKRCRAREERRRQNKDAARKKQVAADTDVVAPNAPRPSLRPPSEDYITGENAVQYDPHRIGQVVEEPPWDPTIPDWRHEIVLFNSPPDVAVKDGSAFWLPFRVICYCKCHGEKVGFRIKFTLRTFDGRIIASEITHPIKITDDHKTDAKSKPRVDRFAAVTGPQPPRARKGRMSTASSQRVSPAPSESEMSVTSEVGAVTQKQTPQVRQGKPYERPPSQSPAVQTSALPFDFLNQAENQRPRLSRQVSASSYASQPDITNWTPEAIQQCTVSPDALRRPNFASMTPMTNINNMSNPSSHAPSPNPALNGMGGAGLGVNGLGSNDMFGNDINVSHQGLDLSALGAAQNPLFANQQSVPQHDVDMANVASELESMLMFGGGSSHASVTSSSYQDDHSSVFSGFNNQGSLFSDSGLPPQESNSLDDMIDYSGGESNSAISPMQGLSLSPTVGMGSLDLGTGPSPFQQPGSLPRVGNNSANDHEAQTRALLALLAQQQVQVQPQPVPVVSHVIPAEGDMAGGVPVAIAGRLFQPDTVIVFGGRPAITTYVSDSFLQCTLPPSPTPGDVEVTVQGHIRDMNAPAMLFRYTGMDREMMRLMLEVRQRHAAADPAVRLVDHLARSNQNSDISDRSSMSPAGGKPSYDASAAPLMDQATIDGDQDEATLPAEPMDLQTTLVTCLDWLDTSVGPLQPSGVVNLRNKAQQTLLHLATVLNFSRLLRRLIAVGAELDLQDVNGFTPLAFAALCGHTACARILLEAGAAYDVPTVFGEMPLDLAKVDDENEVEGLLLAAVWSTNPDVPVVESDYELSPDSESDLSGIDNDNPSSSSESESDEDGVEVDSISNASRALRSRKAIRRRGKQRSLDVRRESPLNRSRRTSPKESPETSAFQSIPRDDPPPYAPPEAGSWMSRTLSNISHPISDTINGALPTFLGSWEKHQQQHPGTNWVAFPAPSWDTLQKLTSPEEVKLFTQAMAAAAFNAVVQSGATTSHLQETSMSPSPVKLKQRRKRRASEDSRSSGQLSSSVVEQVKQDRMLYLFWLPVLLFVGFWLLVTALPIATGFCLIYARQIGRAIKQRL